MPEENINTQKDSFHVQGELGDVQITDEVVAVIAGIAATEVEGVESMNGSGDSIQKDIISRLGMKVLSKGVRINIEEDSVAVDLSVNLAYGYNIPEVTRNIQERVKSEIENMTGLRVTQVNVSVVDVELDSE